ncbi:hemolysin family protein [Coralliovum pocilloporae]|uniref:hemolysin family protein n=1 Tax=Coralliovum pocilloporae TaxID=3066369 RepID=UPI003306C1F5
MTPDTQQTPSITDEDDDSRSSKSGSSETVEPVKADTQPARQGEPWIDRLRNLLGFRDPGRLRHDLEQALTDDHGEASDFSPEEKEMLRNILRLREVRVDDVMVPRADINAVEADITLGALLEIFREAGHSRMPVYNDTLDDPRGMVHIKDVMAYIIETAQPNGDSKTNLPQLDDEHVDLTRTLSDCNLIRDVLFVPPSMPATDLLAKMQASRTQMALVIDEYGGTDGLVSLEDVVETVVGDIEDEHDVDDSELIVEAGADQWIADARVALDDLAETLGDDFHAGEHSEDVDTLGGLLFVLIGRIPVRGELITALPNFEFEVVDADPRRIKKLRIFKGKQGVARPKLWRGEARSSDQKS